MLRFAAFALAFSILALPARAEELVPSDRAAQNLAIAASVQEQLLSCWSLPAGYEGRRISVRLAFFGDGSIDGQPELEAESERVADKYPTLLRSIARAIAICLPFRGLEALGAGAEERFDITVHFRS